MANLSFKSVSLTGHLGNSGSSGAGREDFDVKTLLRGDETELKLRHLSTAAE